MANSLKDALVKAGLRSSKMANERTPAKGRPQKQSEKHQRARTFCEVCELDHGDVEFYKHRNPTIDARWICLGCADKHMIDDQFRTTRQSELSTKSTFKRFYGATKTFDDYTQNKQPKVGRKTNRRPSRKS